MLLEVTATMWLLSQLAATCYNHDDDSVVSFSEMVVTLSMMMSCLSKGTLRSMKSTSTHRGLTYVARHTFLSYNKTEGDLSAVLKVVILKFWPHQPCSWIHHPLDRFGASLNYWFRGLIEYHHRFRNVPIINSKPSSPAPWWACCTARASPCHPRRPPDPLPCVNEDQHKC